ATPARRPCPRAPAGTGVRWHREPQRYLWLGGWFVLAARDCCFGRLEATSRVGPVAEGLRGRAAAAAQSKRTLWNCVGGAVPIDRRYIIALDQIGAVLHHFDRCHLDDLLQCRCRRKNLPHTACLDRPTAVRRERQLAGGSNAFRRSISLNMLLK